MGLFRRRRRTPDREHALAEALARRGVAGRATVVTLRPTGSVRAAGWREFELTLDLDQPDGPPLRIVQRQFMTAFTLHGLKPGEPARVLYDGADPRRLLVHGHAHLRTEIVAGELVAVGTQPLDAPRPRR